MEDSKKSELIALIVGQLVAAEIAAGNISLAEIGMKATPTGVQAMKDADWAAALIVDGAES